MSKVKLSDACQHRSLWTLSKSFSRRIAIQLHSTISAPPIHHPSDPSRDHIHRGSQSCNAASRILIRHMTLIRKPFTPTCIIRCLQSIFGTLANCLIIEPKVHFPTLGSLCGSPQSRCGDERSGSRSRRGSVKQRVSRYTRHQHEGRFQPSSFSAILLRQDHGRHHYQSFELSSPSRTVTV